MMSNPDLWFQTYKGVEFSVPHFRPETINIEDIAHSLSLQCRFNGHIKQFYSVAQHSVLVCERVPPEDKLWGLLHDASEAYLSDVPAPMKRLMADYLQLERALMRVICDVFGLPYEMPATVKEADLRMLATEKRDLVASPEPRVWDSIANVEPYNLSVAVPWEPIAAEAVFLQEFKIRTEGWG